MPIAEPPVYENELPLIYICFRRALCSMVDLGITVISAQHETIAIIALKFAVGDF